VQVLIAIRDMHPSEGGPPVVVAGHAQALAKMGNTVTVVATTLAHQRAETLHAWRQLADFRIDLQLFERVAPLKLGRSPTLKSFVEREIKKFDAVHLHGIWEQCLTDVARTARRHTVPYAIAPHGMLDRWSRARSRLRKIIAWRLLGVGKTFRNANALQFGTVDERNEAADLGVLRNPVIIRNGIDPYEFSSRGEQFDLATELPKVASHQSLLVFYSRMHPKKGVDILLEAFARVLPDFPNTKLLIAALSNDTAYEVKMRARAECEDIADSVLITTELTGRKGLGIYDHADLFVLPSRQEGFSMAVLEAMVSGVPVLVTHACHMDFIAEVNAGFVAEVSIDGVAKALRDFLRTTASERELMAQNARDWILDNCTWESIGKQLVDMYNVMRDTNNSRLR
jgi:glycosyltransferase involved in cell wall biosynthesis